MSLTFLFFLLQSGVYLHDFKVSNINIKKLYLKWDTKLNIYIESLDISKSDPSSSEKKQNFQLESYAKDIYYLLKYFESIKINDLTYGDLIANVDYETGKDPMVSISFDQLHLNTQISVTKDHLDLKLEKMELENLSANGHIYMDLNSFTMYSKIDLLINNDANLSVFTRAGKKQLEYKVLAHTPIKDYKQILRPLSLPKEIEYWVYDAIELQDLELENVTGFIDFDDLANGYKNLHATAKANKLAYRYNPKLDSIHTEYTDLEFKQGILYIHPQEATTYGFDLNTSWLKIDFAQPKEILTLFLNFSAQLNDDILSVLNAYKITLPMKQNSGDLSADLQLAVNLHTLDVDAHGVFTTQKGNYHYLGQDIDVKDLKVQLDNFDISIENMLASYNNMVDAKVNVVYNAKEAKGDVDFSITKFHITDQIKLDTKPLKATYHINKKQDLLWIEKSSWLYDTQKIDIAKIEMPLDIDSLKLKLPATYFTFEDITKGFISGNVDLNKTLADLDLDLLNINYSGVKSTQSNIPLKLKFSKGILSVDALDPIYLNAASSEFKISKLALELQNSILHLKKPLVQFGQFTKAQVDAKYSFKSNKGEINLLGLIVKDPTNGTTIYKKNKLSLSAITKENTIEITSKELGASFEIDNTHWLLSFNSLRSLYKNSPLMRKYHLNQGVFKVYKNLDEGIARFRASIAYPYKIFYKNDKAIDIYTITGELNKQEKFEIKINDIANITMKENINVNIKNTTVALSEVLKMLQDFQGSSSGDSSKVINLFATNSKVLLGEKRHVLMDKLELQYHNKIVTAQMEHLKGKAGFKLEEKNFHLYGENFGDSFMDNLFKFSKFKEGIFSFNIRGTLDKYKGTMLIEKSTLQDYTILNNVLAFINTVPSLITFSVPGYSTKGIYMNHSYLNFEYENDFYNISDFYMDSKELKISAQGKASITKDSVDMLMNLKTDLASGISQVPLVGYIIFDGKALSTSVKVEGKLSDPSVKSELAKEIVVAPFNIIKRTIQLPLKIFE